jgi:hypothetical protein
VGLVVAQSAEFQQIVGFHNRRGQGLDEPAQANDKKAQSDSQSHGKLYFPLNRRKALQPDENL